MSKDIRAMVVGIVGETQVIDIPAGGFQQAFRQHCEAQYFDHLDLAQDLDLWVDDEGLLTEPVVVNWAATDLRDTFWMQNGIEIPSDWPPLAGKALLTGGADDEGETLSLSDGLIEQLEGFFATWREGANA
jgi:hypothetical protein